jgi:DNA invertase Pin-like site-specific DNA recombinase
VKVGYARVSTDEQNLDLQVDALRAAGCERVFTETASGGGMDRAQLRDALGTLQRGDVFIVWSLDRLGRSLSGVVLLLDDLLLRQGVEFRSVKEAIDTSTAAGRLQIHMLAALAEFERGRIAERTREGLAAAKARGRVGGRPKKMTRAKIDAAKTLLASGIPPADVAEQLGVSRATLYKTVAVADMRNASVFYSENPDGAA